MSSSNTTEFKKVAYNPKELGFLKFSTTRWSAAYFFVSRLLTLETALEQWMRKERFPANLVLTAKEWVTIQEVAALLYPLQGADADTYEVYY